VLDTGLGYFFLTRSRFGAWSDSSWQYRSKAKPRVKRGATKEGMSEIEQPALKIRRSAPPNKPDIEITKPLSYSPAPMLAKPHHRLF
jgi:hypothetical protein